LDVGHALAGPFACSLLADLGADVIKVERPDGGDSMRELGPRKNGSSVWWKAAARNKRSVTLDFRRPRATELFSRLVEPGAFAVMAALFYRETSPGREGQMIDLALYETLFRLIDWQPALYDALGEVPVCSGDMFPGLLSGIFATVARAQDGQWLTVSAATP